MPRDGTAEENKTPLKRGDACLYCRKRRIKCSADKPSCQHCTKLSRECVYDTGKPVSRVKQLEDKVAELEEMLKLGASGAVMNAIGSKAAPPLPRHSSSSSSVPSTEISSGPSSAPFVYDAGGSGSNQSSQPSQPLYPDTYGMYNQSFTGTFGQTQTYAPSGVNPAAVEMFDFTTLDPNFMNLINSLGSTTTNQPDVPMQVDVEYNVSTGLTPFLDPDGGQPSVPPSTYGMNSAPQPISIQPTPPSSTKVSYHAYVTEVDSRQSPAQTEQHIDVNMLGKMPNPESNIPNANGLGGRPGWKSWMDEKPSGEEKTLTGGWFDPTDLPKVARDHLLDLFFSSMRMFGQEFHIPRFFASLSLPMSKRPHPCLLYTMYLVACRLSTTPAIRSLESHFYKIAMEQLEEAIASTDRLFDAVRAATILSVYKFSLAKYHEGWMMSGRALRLAISCGLHAIPSSVWKPSHLPKDHRADLIGLMRQRSWVLPPPADAVALGERIWAFWSVYLVDRAGAISTQWPTGLSDADITTPLPRPLQDYELAGGLAIEADDMTVSHLYDPEYSRPLPHYSEATFINLRLRAMSILERASKLMYLKPEKGWQDKLRETSSTSPPSNSPPDWVEDVISYDQYLLLFGASPGSDSRRPSEIDPAGKGWMRCAKVRTPRAYQEVYEALMRIEGDMPPERRTNWEVWDGNVQDWHFGSSSRQELSVLHFVLGCAWMFLFDVFSFNAPNDKAVAVARRLAFTVRSMSGDTLHTDLDVFIAMTWSFVVKVLIREVKRLHSKGDHRGAVPIEKEIDIIVQALKTFGKKYSIASYQAERADQYRKSTAAETQFLEDPDNLDDAHLGRPNDPPTFREHHFSQC